MGLDPTDRPSRPSARAPARSDSRESRAVLRTDPERVVAGSSRDAEAARSAVAFDAGRRIAARRVADPAGPSADSAPAPPRRARGRQTRLDDADPTLARLLHDVDGATGSGDARRRAAEAIGAIAARLAPVAAEAPATAEADLFANARRLLSRQWGHFGLLQRADQVDAFGQDAVYEARAQPVLDRFFERYFRVELDGAEHLPAEGPALLVCNRGGILPWDGVMLKTALRLRTPGARALRWLAEDFVFHAPFLGVALNRLGAVRACQENAARLLAEGELLAVFPEGEKGVRKTYRERYRLQRFGRGGYVKLALRTRVPLLPVAIVGAEDSYPLLARVTAFSRVLGVPFLPVTPLFPWLGPFGFVPLPSRWRIAIGRPIEALSEHAAEAADDPEVVSALNENVRATIQRMLDTALTARGPRAFSWPAWRRARAQAR